MKKTIYSAIFIIAILTFISCEKNEDTAEITKIEYVGFENGLTIQVPPLGTKTQGIKVATSTKTTGNRIFFLKVNDALTTADASAYVIPPSVTVLANQNLGVFDIELIGVNINPSGEDILVIEFISPRNGTYVSGAISISLRHLCENTEVLLNLTFDDYPEEVYWRLLDSNNVIVYESLTSNGTDPEWGAYAGIEKTSKIEAFCLPSGDYVFEMYDAYDDGAGPFNLTLDGDIIFSSDGVYGGFVSTPITIP